MTGFDAHHADERAKSIAKELSGMVNAMGFANPGKDLAELIVRDHRTLQQSTFREFIIPLLRLWATDWEEGRYDARNEGTVHAAWAMMQWFDDEQIALPLHMSTVKFNKVAKAIDAVLAEHGEWPWQLIGVVPSQEDVDRLGSSAWDKDHCFAYTVGLTPLYDLWLPAESIEGRKMPIDLTASVLNWLASAFSRDLLERGDDVEIPLGVLDADDMIAIFWIGDPEVSNGSGQPRDANVSDAVAIVPVLWSSPLGWPE